MSANDLNRNTHATTSRPKARGRAKSARSARLPLERLEGRETPAIIDLRGVAHQGAFAVSPAGVVWGDVITVRHAIFNWIASPAAPPLPFATDFRLSTDPTITADDPLLLKVTGYTVPPNAYFPILSNVSMQLPPVNPFGAYTGPLYLGMIIDSDNTVAEVNEGNNAGTAAGHDYAALAVQPPVVRVADSVGTSTDLQMDFGSVVVDGPDHSLAVQTVTIGNSAARAPLTVPSNGVRLAAGTHFKILDITSNRWVGPVSIGNGPNRIEANGAETWTVRLQFDPLAAGPLSDTLVIETDSPSAPAFHVRLTGAGAAVPNLVVGGAVANREVAFGPVGADGTGGRSATAAVVLTNNGSGPLTVFRTGIDVAAGPFAVTAVTSSTQGAIDLAAGPRALAVGESWTVGVTFDPTAVGAFQLPLTIRSDDPDDGTATVTLLGEGKRPPQFAAPTAVAFGSAVADGAGREAVTRDIVLGNTGELLIVVGQGQIKLTGDTQFKLVGITSSTQGTIDLAAGARAITPGTRRPGRSPSATTRSRPAHIATPCASAATPPRTRSTSPSPGPG